MSEAGYNDKLISDYLLGRLTDAEVERLDELSVADDDFSDALNVAEKELTDAYVRGELSAVDFKRFESYYLTSTLRREKVEFARALQAYGERASASSASAHALPPATSLLPSLFSNRLPALQWGLALAGVVLLVTGGLLLIQNVGLRRQINQAQAQRDELQQREAELQKQLENQRMARASSEQELARIREERERQEAQLQSDKSQRSAAAIASIVLTPQLRGEGQQRTLALSPDTERVAMQLQLEPTEYSTYSVALIDQAGGQVLWRSGRVKAAGAGDRKSLSVSFRAGLLRAGAYRMQVSGISTAGAAEVVGEYPFRVLKQ